MERLTQRLTLWVTALAATHSPYCYPFFVPVVSKFPVIRENDVRAKGAAFPQDFVKSLILQVAGAGMLQDCKTSLPGSNPGGDSNLPQRICSSQVLGIPRHWLVEGTIALDRLASKN